MKPLARVRMLLALGWCVMAAGVAGCAKREPAGPATDQVLRVSQRNEPGDLDPATATMTDEFAILRALGEGLLIPATAGREPAPGVAEGFEVSTDGLTYTFHLRANARWSNGNSVTAADFVGSYRRLLTPATASPKAAVFYPVKNARAYVTGALTDFSAVGFRAISDQTLEIILERPTPAFPHYVASGPWIPVHLATVKKHGRNWTEPGNFVGNGPFLLTEWRPHQRIVVRRNPRWHGAAGVALDEIQFIRFDSGDAEERAYRAGQVDATMAVPPSKVDVYARDHPDELHRAPMFETRYLTFNTRRPPLDDVRVRRALALALDRAAIAERVVRGSPPPAGRLVPAGLRHESATAPLEELGYDPAAARRLLAEAGISADNFPPLELTGWSNTPVLEAVQAMWKNVLGLEIPIVIRDAKVHLSALATGGYDIAFMTAIPDVADAANLLGDFVTGAPENYPHWSDRAYDAAFAKAMATANSSGRAAALRTAEQRLITAAPISPLYFNAKIWLMSPRVHGWQEDGLWTRCYQQIRLDEK